MVQAGRERHSCPHDPAAAAAFAEHGCRSIGAPSPLHPPPPPTQTHPRRLQQLGLKVIRTWAFNIGMPLKLLTYDARQFAGLDYVVWSAKRHGIRLVFALGNRLGLGFSV